jgi:ribosome-associated protein
MTRELKLKNTDFIPLCDLMKNMAMCLSGGEAKNMIDQGLVKVDGQVETRKRCKIRAGQVVDYNGEQVRVVS